MPRRLFSQPVRTRARAFTGIALLILPGLLTAQVATTGQTHTVRRGDTLWGIAGQYLGDPVLWPEIYRLNTSVVEDPHWIYPGEILQLAAGAVPTPAVPMQDTPAPGVVIETPSVRVDTPPAVVDTAIVLVQVPDTSVSGVLTLSADSAPTDMSPLFGTSARGRDLETTLSAYSQQPYRPLRRVEFYSSGFLSEGQALPLGRFHGPVAASQIAGMTSNASNALYSKVAVTPPSGGSYQVGDSLLLIRIDRRLDNYGDVVVPTGMVRVTDVSRAENTAEVIAIYGPIRSGQFTLPVEQFPDPGEVRPVPISDGVDAAIIESRDEQVLKGPQDVVFINKGRSDGVAVGDLFEVRRSPEARPEGAMTVPEVMAVLQVVHVRDKTATTRVISVVAPNVPSGTAARQIAKLPS
ncbi:MAG TPA: LysM domain-containing protein, partial [Gemmatimonadales bacterium]|nr:LysM domain-containing protein [Gemmatimonadales bacterium]